MKRLMAMIALVFALSVCANLLGTGIVATALRLGMDDGLTSAEIALNVLSLPSLVLATAETVLLFLFSIPFLRRANAAILVLSSLVVGPYYYAMFFSYYLWGNRLEPWLFDHVPGFLVTLLFFVSVVAPYAISILVQAMVAGSRASPRRSAS